MKSIYVVEYTDKDWIGFTSEYRAKLAIIRGYVEAVNGWGLEMDAAVDDIKTAIDDGYIEDYAYIHHLEVVCDA